MEVTLRTSSNSADAASRCCVPTAAASDMTSSSTSKPRCRPQKMVRSSASGAMRASAMAARWAGEAGMQEQG